MLKRIITNATSGVALPEAVEVGKVVTIQVAPEGKYPQFVEDADAEGGQREVVQILDRQAMDTLVANFEKAKAEAEAKGAKYCVLVDADHSSETSTNTEAMGWVTKLYVDDENGLMAEIEPTSLGAEKINGKVYRFVSGAWTLDDDCRPETLVSIGLTNKPNLPVAPMINAAKAVKADNSGTQPNANGEGVTNNAASEPVEDAKGKVGEGEINQNSNEGKINMDLKEKLGLPTEAADADVEAAVDALIEKCAGLEQVQNALGLEATATNDEVLEAVNAVINACGELQAKNEEAEKAKLDAEADQLVAENEDVIPEEMVEEIKEEYIEDPEKAKATVANFRKVHDRAVLNSAKREQPKTVVIKNATAKAPKVGGIAEVIANSKGDAADILKGIAQAYKRA